MPSLAGATILGIQLNTRGDVKLPVLRCATKSIVDEKSGAIRAYLTAHAQGLTTLADTASLDAAPNETNPFGPSEGANILGISLYAHDRR